MKTKETMTETIKERFEVTFRDEIKAISEEKCYDELLNYLRGCVENEDASAFQFVNLSKIKK